MPFCHYHVTRYQEQGTLLTKFRGHGKAQIIKNVQYADYMLGLVVGLGLPVVLCGFRIILTLLLTLCGLASRDSTRRPRAWRTGP